MNNISTKIFSDKQKLENKKQIFKKSYINHKDLDGKKDKIIVVTDFDYTLFNKYKYSTGEKCVSSFGIYNQEVFGGTKRISTKKGKNYIIPILNMKKIFQLMKKRRKKN